MYLPEEEAKTKWCPFALTAVQAWDSVVAENVDTKGQCNCIASACMAWRKHGPETWGYCGLAGRVGE
jgi:hypothetical protein